MRHQRLIHRCLLLFLLLAATPLLTMRTTFASATLMMGSGAVGTERRRYVESNFRRRIDDALAKVRTILDETKAPIVAVASPDVDHAYDDKYRLIELTTNVALASLRNALELLEKDETTGDGGGGGGYAGGKKNVLRKLIDLASESAGGGRRSVTLRFEAKETCSFLNKTTVDVPSSHKFETHEETTADRKKGQKRSETKTSSSRIVTTVTEYHWSISVTHRLVAYVGPDPNDANGSALELQSRTGRDTIVVTGSQTAPRPASFEPNAIEVDATWWLRRHVVLEEENSSNDGGVPFTVNRDAPTCRTPRRNDDVQRALEQFEALARWSDAVRGYLVHELDRRIPPAAPPRVVREESQQPPSSPPPKSTMELASIDDAEVFVPVMPLFYDSDDVRVGNDNDEEEVSPSSSPPTLLLSATDVDKLLSEQRRSLIVALSKLDDAFPPPAVVGLVTSIEARLVLLLRHVRSLTDGYVYAAQHIEAMLETQLVTAIGKYLRPADFEEFMVSHNRRLFKEEFVPHPFVYAVRRPDHYPEGTVSIEQTTAPSLSSGGGGGGVLTTTATEPISTIVRKVRGAAAEAPMYLPLNAATSVEIGGDRYLHAWVPHDFGGGDGGASRGGGGAVNLVARARQFSGFLLLVGTISGPQTFTPKHAIILQNKDEAVLPLLLEQLPTPKEFKDAIASLSPEQQQFAMAFRAMQLESSVFAVCVVQLRPQLELLLGLPYDSLTKEVRLTQDLLSLFIEYQIPSDLLTFDGADSATVEEKVDRVRSHVSAVQGMIEDAKKKELDDAKRETDMSWEERMQSKYKDVEEMEVMDNGEAVYMMDAGGGGEPMEGVRSRRGPPRQQARNLRAEPQMTQMPPQMAQMGSMEAPRMARATADFSAEAIHLRSPPAGVRDEAVGHKPEDAARPPKFTGEEVGSAAGESGNAVDFTQIPKQLDERFDALDEDSSLRPTKIKAGDTWTMKTRKSLLAPLRTTTLGADEIKSEKNRAFDLLDALSKSGALKISYSELHVMVAATHRFDKSVMATVIENNVNPIEKMERSLLIVSSTIHGLPATKLVGDSRRQQLEMSSPALFLEEGEALADETDNTLE